MSENNPIIKNVIGSEYATAIFDLINSAKYSIDVLMFDWRWYEQDPSHPIQQINHAIVRAIRRGVRVRVITSSMVIVNTLKDQGAQAKKLNRTGLMHSKIILVDECRYSIGSHNLTSSANEKNVESSVIISDPITAKAHLDHFNNLWQL